MPFKIGYLSDVMLLDGRGGALLRLCDVDRQSSMQSVHVLACIRGDLPEFSHDTTGGITSLRTVD